MKYPSFEKPGMDEFKSPQDRARERTLAEIGPEPESSDWSQEASDYWDKYYDAYYNHLNDLENQSVTIETPQKTGLIDRFTFEDGLDFQSSNPSSNVNLTEEFLQTIELFRKLIIGEDSLKSETRPLFFDNTKAREEVFRFSEALAEHIKSSGVQNLVIADRSSRPIYVGVMEYWKKAFPKDPLPGIYFVNPKGFKATDKLNSNDLEYASKSAVFGDDKIEDTYQARTHDEIIAEFKKVYTKLLEGKDSKVMLFDSCIHSGDTLDSVISVFRQLGFSNLEIGSVNPSDPGSKVKSDFYITTERPKRGCYPFDRDRMIEKTFEHVYSLPTNDEGKRHLGNLLREEIRQIVREKMTEQV